jgi:ubiquinone/menaquinone biosynthesis C-methylase UbiE
MSPFWSFTLQGKSRVALLPRTLVRTGVRSGLKVLEIGCGPGVVLEQAAGLVQPGGELHAVDIQPEMVHRATARLQEAGIADVRITHAPADALPYEADSFDLVYMVTVIGELPDHAAALSEIRRVLKPGGMLAITEHLMDPHYMGPTRVRDICARAGLRRESTVGGPFEQTSRFTA